MVPRWRDGTIIINQNKVLDTRSSFAFLNANLRAVVSTGSSSEVSERGQNPPQVKAGKSLSHDVEARQCRGRMAQSPAMEQAQTSSREGAQKFGPRGNEFWLTDWLAAGHSETCRGNWARELQWCSEGV